MPEQTNTRIATTTGARLSTGAFAALLSLVFGCGYVPARFSASEPVTRVHDDYPVPVPAQTILPDEIRYSEAYVESAVVDGLDPRRTPDAEDVNSLDEVPASSWFSGARYPDYAAFYQGGPPSLPLREVAGDRSLPKGVRVFLDHDGRRWEIVPNERYRTGMQAGAGVIASRLVSALGYYVAETYPARVDGEKVLAVRFPDVRGSVFGQDALYLGPTDSLGTRPDDRNDVVDHEHRRTLRALGLVAAWIGLDEVRPSLLRDVYVGTPNIGFVQHQIVGLQNALGVGKLVGILHDTDSDRPVSNPWLAFATLGFGPKAKASASATPTASVGLFPEYVDPSNPHFTVPFPPAVQAQPADLYWIGKRISAITHSRIGEAVSAAELEPEASDYLEKSLLARRETVAHYAMSLVSPLEVTALVPARKPNPSKSSKTSKTRSEDASLARSFALDLEDLALRRGFERASTTSYTIDFYGEKGARLHGREKAIPRGSSVRIYVPAALLDESGYVILRILAYRDGSSAPRPLEVHLRGTGTAPLLRGVRH